MAWRAALGVLGRINGIDLRGCADGELGLRRGTGPQPGMVETLCGTPR